MWDWEFAAKSVPQILSGLVVTFQAVAGGMFIALVLGLVWALCRRSRNRFIAWPATAIVEFVRSTPLLAQLYFYFYVLPGYHIELQPLTTGILALGLHYSCYTAEVYRAGLESVPRGQWEAATAVNLSRYQTYRYIILPQAIAPIIPALGNYLIAMFKDAPLLMAITVLEILNQALIIGKETFRYLEPLTIVGVIFLVLSLISGYFITWLEQRLQIAKA